MSGRQRIALLLLLVLGGMLAAYLLDLRELVPRAIEYLRKLGPVSLVYLAVLYILATVFMVPGSILTLAAGFLAALLWRDALYIAIAAGYASVAVGSVVGATLAFLLGRGLARPWVEQRIADNARFQSMDEAVARQGFRMVCLLRLSPLFPFNLLNYALGLTRVKLLDYVLASAIGMLPGTVLYVYIGATAQSLAGAAASGAEANWARNTLLVAGVIATVLVVALVSRAAKKALDSQ